MAVRNFYLQFDIGGRRTKLKGGPQGSNGEFSGTILMRHEGTPLPVVYLWGRVMPDGTLVLRIDPAADVQVEMGESTPGMKVTTKR